MKDRIKRIRKYFGLTQQGFANRLGLKRNSVANYEIGRNTPMDPIINSICKEFGVNEVWLRTGEGGDENMLTKVNDDRFSLNLGKLSTTENQMVKNMLNAIAEASPEKLKYIEEFMKECLGLK
ncbi:helix-turn-helix domain-containing protein [Ruminococcus sp. 5_1_39BFAA]|uniref:helix-turn-helix domain-containing protein n=1 Tax=Ruminococcus sp. 5_1_39BFAA TaxID=457412 RepID=UPI003568CD0C